MLSRVRRHGSEPASPVDAAIAAARSLGLTVTGARLLAQRSNAIVALEPADIVARVAVDIRLASRSTPNARGAYAREVTIAQRLAELGAPVLAPTDLIPPGPHEVYGRLVSFWPRLAATRPAEPEAAGRALAVCRGGLDELFGLPALWLLDEAADLARQPAVVDVLGRRAQSVADELADVRDRLAEFPLAPVHGDAGLGNAVEVEGRVIWIDWEDAMQAPVLWDAACLAATSLVIREEGRARAALAGFGVERHQPELQPLIRARVLQMVPWSALVLARGTSAQSRLAQRLAWLDAN